MRQRWLGLILPFLFFATTSRFEEASSAAFQAGTAPPTLPADQVPAGPQRPPYKPDRPIAIVGGLLLDGTGAAPRHDMTVLTKGDRIVDVGPADQVVVPPGALVVDAAGMTIMPGLIDSNQHIVLNPMYSTPDVGLSLDKFKERWQGNWDRAERMNWVYLMQGITSFRQTPGPADFELSIKKKVERGEIAGSRIFLGGSLWMSKAHWERHLKQHNQTDPAAIDFIKHHFEYNVIEDVKDLDPNKWGQEGPDFNFWKLYMWEEPFDGKNDFTDEELRYIIDRGHKLGKIIDVHCGGHNNGLRRMLAFDVDTLEHPFYGNEIIDWDIITGYVKKGVIVDSLLQVMIDAAERAADPHRFSETLYIMSMDQAEYRLLMRYRDKMLWNLKRPSEPGLAIYPEDSGRLGRSFDQQMKALKISKENMRRFIKAGAKFSTGTDTGAFMNFRQESPYVREMMHMVEMGMSPMDVIVASTKNGAEALGLLKEMGTIEKGKIADLIVVSGNPLLEMEKAMNRVYAVVMGGVRYK